MLEKLIFVTSNEAKLTEAKAILGIDIESVKLEIEEIQSLELEKIVTDKAEKAFSIVKRPLFVDDVGFYLEAWNGFPGPFIRYLHDAGGNDLILRMLTKETNRKVTAKAAIGLHTKEKVEVFIGEVSGTIALEPRGEGGWGYDPIFIPEFSDKTYAEMGSVEKNSVSHRRVALEKLKSFLIKSS